MMFRMTLPALLASLTAAGPCMAQAFGLAELSEQSKQCIACHKNESPALYQQWGRSMHCRANVGCFECHAANKGEPDAIDHYGLISVLVTPKDCSRCHAKEAEQFAASRHSKAARILGSQDNILAEIVEGNQGMVTSGSGPGVSAAAVNGCWQCHGSEVKLLADGKPDPATYPNSGIGRINPDGSEGTCNACHLRHEFSAAQARYPDTCGKCHIGPDHPQKEIYESSKHGIAFFANVDRMNMDSPKWILGEDYSAAPTCATCHMSATKNQPVTHDVGLRISWNNRPAVSVRPEVADAEMGLADRNVPWNVRRKNMRDVCMNCHEQQWVDDFYIQYDAQIELYDDKFAKPGQELMALAAPLKSDVPFANRVDWTWYELWHHEGRRTRHGAAMMSPDYAQWQGMYEVARAFYTQLVPQLQDLVAQGLASSDPAKVDAARALDAKLKEVLNSDDHKWFIGKMDPQEVERRKKAAEQFKKRYGEDNEGGGEQQSAP